MKVLVYSENCVIGNYDLDIFECERVDKAMDMAREKHYSTLELPEAYIDDDNKIYIHNAGNFIAVDATVIKVIYEWMLQSKITTASVSDWSRMQTIPTKF